MAHKGKNSSFTAGSAGLLSIVFAVWICSCECGYVRYHFILIHSDFDLLFSQCNYRICDAGRIFMAHENIFNVLSLSKPQNVTVGRMQANYLAMTSKHSHSLDIWSSP